MFKQFYDDFTYLPKRKFNAKYTVPVLIFFLACVLVGQLLSMLVPLSDLGKVSGHIVDMDTKVVSWSHSRFSSHDDPNYALFINLDNNQSYDIQNNIERKKLTAELKAGDFVTIYYPTEALKIMSAGMLEDVSQLERGRQILYSWKEQQNEVWFLVAMLVAAIVVFYLLMKHFRNSVDILQL